MAAQVDNFYKNMALKTTNLTIQMAPLPLTFKGTPNDLAIEMIKRMRILSPSGSSFIFEGDTEPTSNVGPWLKGGTQWFVWDSTLNKYVPQDISASFTIPFWMSKSQPPSASPQLWLRTEKDATDLDPTHGRPVGWYQWDGTTWRPFNSQVSNGTTAQRPASPVDFQEFYDTDINCRIWWERGAWRTIDGVPGDVKSVLYQTLTDALLHNPGWSFVGDTAPQLIGRAISMATQDPGATPVTVLTPPALVPSRAAFDTFGEVTGVTAQPGSTTTLPPMFALWTLYKL